MLRLKELRAKFNMTQKDLAERLEMSQQAIAKWENGAAEPTVKNLRELAAIFGTSVDDLLGNSETIKTTHFCNYGPKKNEDLEIQNEDRWFFVETLNNKNLLINKHNIKKITLLDDACDNDPDDWDLQWDAYGGDAAVAYNCLYEYSCGETKNIPEKMLMGIKDVIKNSQILILQNP